MEFNYYYGNQADQFSFIRIPRVLLVDPLFEPLTIQAKLLYGVLLDRMGISMRNGWFDELNRVYAISRSFHEFLPWRVVSADAVQDDMNMNITGISMPIRVRTYKHLMSGEICRSKGHSQLLSPLCCKTILITISWIKADDIVMGFNLCTFRVLTKMSIGS